MILKTFERAAVRAGMSDKDVEYLVDLVANNPMMGDEIAGTGGCRKARIAGRGKGKSGGYRVVTFYSGQDVPVTLITVFSKGEKDNLSKAERGALGQLAKELVSACRQRVVRVGKRA